MWSEHCSYKSSRIHLKKLPTRGKLVVQGPGENAGIIDIGGGYVIAFKIESHNHPSLHRAVPGRGHRRRRHPARHLHHGRAPHRRPGFAPLRPPRRSRPARATAASSKAWSPASRITATASASPPSAASASSKPATTAIRWSTSSPSASARRKKSSTRKAAGVGNPVIYVGAKTGRDGIHGASMASAEFTEESKQKRPNVQVGDPFLEKLLLEACLEAMKTGAIVGIQDMGAAGLTCSTCEMGSRGEVGIEIDLDRVPQRETGMTAYEIMLSESQERMLLVAEKGREDEVFHVFRKWGLDAVTIGVVTADGTPARPPSRRNRRRNSQPRARRRSAALRPPAHATPLRDRAACHGPDFRRRRSQRRSARPPRLARYLFQALDLGAVRLSGPHQHHRRTRRRCRHRAHQGNRHLRRDVARWQRPLLLSRPREGAKLAVAECCRNLATVGALPVAATNNLNFGNPERPEIMAQLVEAIEGMAEACASSKRPSPAATSASITRRWAKASIPRPCIGIVGLHEDRAARHRRLPECGPRHRSARRPRRHRRHHASAAPSTRK